MDHSKYAFQNVMIAVDGSEKSKEAFYQAMDLMSQGQVFNKVNIVHVWDKKKTYLPAMFTKDHIEQEYKNELLSRFSQNRYNLIFQDHSLEFANSRDQILSICTKNKGDLLFIGYTGRKGVKNDPTLMSQTVRSAAQSFILPLVIVKQLYLRKETKNQGFNFLVCVDGSKKSLQCLNKAVSMATYPGDQIITCFTPTPQQVEYREKVNQVVQNSINAIGFKGKWKHITLTENYDASVEIIKFVNFHEETDINFVVLGNNGYRAELEKKAFFGRSAEQILSKINANPIIVT